MNKRSFNSLVKGRYGRYVPYTNESVVTEENVIKIMSDGYSAFSANKPVVRYLWNYYLGDQPSLYREKTIREDINIPIVENHAHEIVLFKTAQTYGEPIVIVSTTKDEKISEAVDKFNGYCRASNKHVNDLMCGEWQSAVGTGYEGIQRRNGEIPFRLTVPTPLDSYVVYNRYTDEPILAVQEIENEKGETLYSCYSETHEYLISGNELVTLSDGSKSRIHVFGGIPIIEFPNNQSRLSDIELVITMLDALNEMQSNRSDSVAQFVQSWVKFVNCDIDENKFKQMKAMGALAVDSNSDSKNADIDILTQELNQSQTQIAKEDLWNNVLNIVAIPNKEGNTGGDTAGAVELRNGWDMAKSRAKIKDAYVKESERRLNRVLLTLIRQAKGANECPISEIDYDVQIVHSPTDNLFVKSESLEILLRSGIHPLVAIRVCGLWSDSEKVYVQSKPYLDAIYKTIDQKIAEQQLEAQIAQAKEILKARDSA